MRKVTGKHLQWLLLAIIGIVIVILVVANNIWEPVSFPAVGTKAPNFSLKTPEGETVRLSDYQGQPVLVNFWASWCPPCWTEAPVLEEVFQKNRDDGLVILAISLSSDSLSGVMSFMEQFDITFPILLDESGTVEQMYQLQGLPASYFIDRNGVIQHTFAGPAMTEEEVNTFVGMIME